MKRIYIAAPWDRRHEMPAIAWQFEEAGYEITHRWWEEDTDIPAELRKCAENDWRAVRTADALVVINSQPRGQETSGKAVETGLAIAYGLPIFVVGEITNIFHYLPQVRLVASVDEALELVEHLR